MSGSQSLELPLRCWSDSAGQVLMPVVVLHPRCRRSLEILEVSDSTGAGPPLVVGADPGSLASALHEGEWARPAREALAVAARIAEACAWPFVFLAEGGPRNVALIPTQYSPARKSRPPEAWTASMILVALEGAGQLGWGEDVEIGCPSRSWSAVACEATGKALRWGLEQKRLARVQTSLPSLRWGELLAGAWDSGPPDRRPWSWAWRQERGGVTMHAAQL